MIDGKLKKINRILLFCGWTRFATVVAFFVLFFKFMNKLDHIYVDILFAIIIPLFLVEFFYEKQKSNLSFVEAALFVDEKKIVEGKMETSKYWFGSIEFTPESAFMFHSNTYAAKQYMPREFDAIFGAENWTVKSNFGLEMPCENRTEFERRTFEPEEKAT